MEKKAVKIEFKKAERAHWKLQLMYQIMFAGRWKHVFLERRLGG